MSTITGTATQLLDAAQLLVQERGFNAFSYKDLASAVGIRTASIHYHFQTKADLGKALMVRYLAQLEQTLGEFDRKGGKNRSKLKKFIGLYRATEERGAICLCGSLAADLKTLPEDLQSVVTAYLDESEKWVIEKIRNGVRSGEFALGGTAASLASTLVAGLQGGLILARAQSPCSTTLDNVERAFCGALKKP